MKFLGSGYISDKGVRVLTDYLLVDGYNVINAWNDLKKLQEHDIEMARKKLIEILAQYQMVKGIKVVIVFDAYLVKGGRERREIIDNVEIVFTKEGETADNFIEKQISILGGGFKVTAVTSDWTEQQMVLALGGARMSPRELLEEVADMVKEIKKYQENPANKMKHTLEHRLSSRVKGILEKWRQQK